MCELCRALRRRRVNCVFCVGELFPWQQWLNDVSVAYRWLLVGISLHSSGRPPNSASMSASSSAGGRLLEGQSCEGRTSTTSCGGTYI